MRIDVDKYNAFVANFFESKQSQIADELKEVGRDLNLTEPITPLDIVRVVGVTTGYFASVVTPVLLRNVLENLDDLTEKH